MIILFLQEMVKSPKRGTEGIGEVRYFKTLISVFGFEWNHRGARRGLRGWRGTSRGGGEVSGEGGTCERFVSIYK